jgi:hypothetical protein
MVLPFFSTELYFVNDWNKHRKRTSGNATNKYRQFDKAHPTNNYGNQNLNTLMLCVFLKEVWNYQG